MRGLSVNDSFPTKNEAEEAMTSHAIENNLSYDVEETSKFISLLCKGREEFGCEAKIIAQLRKKDDAFVIKRIKLSHKCPSVTLRYGSPDEMVRQEIHKVVGDKDVRVGEMVKILSDMDIRMGYFSVWKAIHQDKEKENVNEESVKRYKIDGNGKIDLVECALDELSNEFLALNFDATSHHQNQMFFFSFPTYLDVFIPIVEIRIYKRIEGFVVFGVLRDPISSPIVYSCVISDCMNRDDVLRYFINSTPDVFFLIDFDIDLINVLQSGGREFFVKTRDVCRFYYNKGRSIEIVERIWSKCNNDIEFETPEIEFLEKKRYIKKYCDIPMLGLQNMSECDVDFINLGVFNLPLFDCLNGILKMIGDNMKQKKKINSGDTKSLFGQNVRYRIERNLSMASDDAHKVDLQNQVCTCGKFQEFLIPCPHACRMIVNSGEDPYLYVSEIYSKARMMKINDVVPVVDLVVRCQSDKHLLKRGPGRPKKAI